MLSCILIIPFATSENNILFRYELIFQFKQSFVSSVVWIQICTPGIKVQTQLLTRLLITARKLPSVFVSALLRVGRRQFKICQRLCAVKFIHTNSSYLNVLFDFCIKLRRLRSSFVWWFTIYNFPRCQLSSLVSSPWSSPSWSPSSSPVV